jgi:NAD-dependent SIR2 family protein deacetylase
MSTCPECKVEMTLKHEGGIQKKLRMHQCPQCKGTFLSIGGVVAKHDPSRDGWYCVSCGSEIQQKTVAHTVRDGLFAFSGSGEVHNEQVPFCPKCENEPSFHGTAITESGEPTA